LSPCSRSRLGAPEVASVPRLCSEEKEPLESYDAVH
jgi:hypothetical protein